MGAARLELLGRLGQGDRFYFHALKMNSRNPISGFQAFQQTQSKPRASGVRVHDQMHPTKLIALPTAFTLVSNGVSSMLLLYHLLR